MTALAAYEIATAKAMLEKTLQEHVRQRALAYGWAFYHPWNSRNSAAGFPDCTLVRGPRLVFAELKREGQRPRPAQQQWLDALAAASAEVYVWRPSDLLSGAIDDVLRPTDRRTA